MLDPAGHCVALMRLEHDGVAILQIDQQLTLEHQEELIRVVVMVPVEVTLDHAQAHHGVVDRGQGLVEPWLVLGDLRRNVDQREAAELVVEAVAGFATEHHASMIDVSIGALLANDTVSTVIAGATKPEQVQTNAAAARWIANESDLDELERLLDR